MSEAQHKIQLVCLVIIATVLGAGALLWLRPVMVPFALAIFLTYALLPVVEQLMKRLKLPRMAAIVGALCLGALGFFLVGGLISGSMHSLGQKAPLYEQRFNELLHQALAWLNAQGVAIDQASIKSMVKGEQLTGVLGKATNAAVNVLSNSFLILIFAIYLLVGRDPGGPRQDGLRDRIEGRIKRYITLKLMLSAATGTLVGLFLWMLGIDLALVFGVLAFMLNFIPSVGSVIATALPLPIILFTPGISTTVIILAVVLPGTVQMVVGNVIEPKLMGDSLELHPITVLIALILWGMLWGIPGMLLGVPITAVIKIMLDDFEPGRPIADLMAGKLPDRSEEASP